MHFNHLNHKYSTQCTVNFKCICYNLIFPLSVPPRSRNQPPLVTLLSWDYPWRSCILQVSMFRLLYLDFLQYTFPWGKESVDCMTVSSDFHKCMTDEDCNGLLFNKESMPYVIQIKTDINAGNNIVAVLLNICRKYVFLFNLQWCLIL